MKTPSSFIFDLVHSLTKSEKRYIKIQARSAGNDYIQLMDALLFQKKFDEDQLIKNNEGANFLKHLAVSKRYLYDLLLKSLANFGQKKLADKVNQKIIAANVLIEKGLFVAAFNELKKGQKIAYKYELFELQIILFGIEKKLLSTRQFKKQSDEALESIFIRENQCLQELQNTNEYWFLSQKIAQFQIRFQKIINEEQHSIIKEIVESKKFKNSTLATNFKSKYYYFQANAIYQFMQGKVENAYDINSQFLTLLEENPHFLRLYAEQYLATLNNMLIDSLIIGKYDKLEQGIERLSQTVERPEFTTIKNIESQVFRQRYLLLLNWSISQKDFKKALEWIPLIEEGLDKFGKKIEKHHRITFYYLASYLLFLNGKYNESLKWNFLILNDNKEDVVKEIFYFARLLNLLIHYELKNYNLLESLILSTPKYLKARRKIYETEKVLFRFIRKLINSKNKVEEQKLKDQFKINISELAKVSTETRVFNYLDLRLWIK